MHNVDVLLSKSFASRKNRNPQRSIIPHCQLIPYSERKIRVHVHVSTSKVECTGEHGAVMLQPVQDTEIIIHMLRYINAHIPVLPQFHIAVIAIVKYRTTLE